MYALVKLSKFSSPVLNSASCSGRSDMLHTRLTPVDHSITSSARSSTLCGIVSPSAFAVFWLIVR